jgi:hypothetical protein
MFLISIAPSRFYCNTIPLHHPPLYPSSSSVKSESDIENLAVIFSNRQYILTQRRLLLTLTSQTISTILEREKNMRPQSTELYVYEYLSGLFSIGLILKTPQWDFDFNTVRYFYKVNLVWISVHQLHR